ncbi:hypothetical protein BDF14DRAFT_1847144 [Spinellus fusiger]|nr:hypothetical protein BDF14DRAFT_1847144 [Spinellus fusiger]
MNTGTHNLFQKQAPIFSGTICNKHTEAWKGDLFDLVSNHLLINLVKTKLEGPAATAIAHKDFTNLDELYSFLKDRFPHYSFQSEIQAQLEVGNHFGTFTAISCVEEARRLYALLGPSNASAYTMAKAISASFPEIWVFTGMAPLCVKCSNFEAVLEMFEGFAEMAPAVIPRLKRGNEIKNSS